ncbi:hypothetical protein Hanom_Chr11g01013441 [Helianthus anomalus]
MMNATMVDPVSQPRRLAEIRRRWMHDNKAEEDLKRVTTHLAQESVIWARDIAENDRILSYTKAVQEELECTAVTEAQKVRYELSAKMKKFLIDTDFVSQVRERYQSLTMELEASNAKAQAKQARLKEAGSALDQSNAEIDSLTSRLAGLQGDRNWLISNGLVGAFEYLRQLEPFVTLLDRLSTGAYKSGHDGYFSCQQTGRITPEFQEMGGKLTTEMADALEAVYIDSLPAYAELVDKVAEDDVDSLRHMLDVAEESGEESVLFTFHCSLDIFLKHYLVLFRVCVSTRFLSDN